MKELSVSGGREVRSCTTLTGSLAAEPTLRKIIEVLQQVMCAHDAEELAISVLEIHEGGYREGRPSD